VHGATFFIPKTRHNLANFVLLFYSIFIYFLTYGGCVKVHSSVRPKISCEDCPSDDRTDSLYHISLVSDQFCINSVIFYSIYCSAPYKGRAGEFHPVRFIKYEKFTTAVKIHKSTALPIASCTMSPLF